MPWTVKVFVIVLITLEEQTKKQVNPSVLLYESTVSLMILIKNCDFKRYSSKTYCLCENHNVDRVKKIPSHAH